MIKKWMMYFVVFWMGFVPLGSWGAVSFTGTTYTQDFDTLANTGTTNSTLPFGWELSEAGGGARDNEQYAADTGSSSTGDTYSFGAATSTERAFGGLQSGTLIPTIGASFQNDTGSTLTELTIQYTGEQWRLGATARVDRLDFQYSTDATSLTTGSWTDVNALDFTAPVTTPTGALDGNAAANKTAKTATITSLSIASGSTFWIRWTDFNASGADDGLAVDNFSLSVPTSTPTVNLSVSSNSGTEAATTAITVTATASSAVSGDQTVNLAVTGTGITAGDYSLTNTTITILSGQTTGSTTFTIVNDTDVESAETATLTISTPSAGISLGSTTSQAIAITDNDAGGTLNYSPTSLSETRALDGAITDKITITLSGDTFTGIDGDNFVTASKVAVSNVPAGLTATVTRTSATTAELSFSGTTSSHANSNDVNTLTLVFANSAFTSGNASAMLNSTKNDLNLDFGDAGAAGSTQTFTPNTGTTVDNSDASTALALDANWMVVADDEASVLRVYPRAGGAAVMEWSFATGLGTGTNEIDLEASTRIGNSLYFIGSHSNKKDGTAQSSREHLFEVTVAGTGANTQFTYVGKQTGLETALKTWDSGNTHGKGSNYFGFTASAAGGVIPENVNGFSIEGMTATQDGTQLLLAFRAPMANTTVRDKAVIVPVSVTGLIGGSPTFGTPFELNLGGRGVRSIEKAVTGSDYLILAGPSVSATTEVTHDFRLYRWDGSSSTPTELDVDLDTLLVSTGGSFETLVDVLSTAQGTLIQLLQDNGDTIWSGQTQASKDLAAAAQKFQGNWVSLGTNITDTTAPTLVSSSPVNSATNATVNTDIVLKFNEAVKAGTGNFVIKKASDNSTVETLALGSANVGIAYNTVTLNPTTTLDYNTAYYVEASNTVITDTANNGWGGLSGSTAYSFTTAIATPLPSVLITEVNSNATGGDFFELYNYGSTAIDLTGWKWNDSAATTTGAIAFPAMSLAAGARLVVVVDANTTTFLSAWNLPATAPVIATGTNPGLGSGDGVVVFDNADKVVASFNYKTSNITASDSTVITPAVRSDGNAVISGHASVAMGGTDAKASAIWDEQSTSAPKYTYAQAGQRGAFSQATAANGTGSPTVIPIHTIQGTGTTAALTGVQTISGIVTKKFSGLTGFFVQEENTDADADPTTSEGIFIYDNSNLFTGNVGNLVRITGTVAEYTSGSSSSTQLSSLTNVTVISTDNTLPTAATVQIPVTNVSDLERFEGMLVNVSSTSGDLVVTETYRLGQYGQITLADSRLQQFTHANAPSTSGYSAHLANIAKRIIYLDDGSTTQNPDPEIFARGGNPLSASNTLRSGDTVSSVTGILDHRYEGYRIQTTSGVNFIAANTRSASAPSVGTPNVKVASFNLLNYFNQFTNCPLGVGGATSTSNCRGAENTAEFTRQKDKHKQVFIGLNADVIGLMELANNGYDGSSAQQDLLTLINSAGLSGRSYAMVNADGLIGSTNALGTDAIKVGLIYDDNALDLVTGSVKTSGNAIFDRQPLAATFQHTATGEKFTVVVNHLKSKGSAASLPGDTDQNDGQGNSNATRTAQATALVAFLNTLTDDSDILVIGDMNAYAQENPITTIKNAGYTDLLGSSKYSYVFDGQIGYLDHALASASLVPQITGADDWHINADEPSVLDYNTNYKSAGQISSFYNADAYRSSDHDPVLIGIKLAPKYNLTLVANGSGSVSSSGTPTGVNCGTNCLSYLSTTTVSLNATAASGHSFSNWSCTPSFTSGNVLTANTTCTATFIPNPAAVSYTLTLKTDGDGQGTLGGTAAGTYDEGTTIKLTATPDADSTFKGWSPSTCAATFYLFADTTCTATFETKATAKAALTLQIIGQGSLSGTAAGLYPIGTNVQLIATPAANYRFMGWSPANCAAFNLTADTLCVARFETDTSPVNTPPVNIRSLNDLLVTIGDADYTLDLSSFFSDAEDAILNYSVTSTQAAVTTTLLQTKLTLQFAQIGSSMIEITAQDSGGLSTTGAFLVTVASRPLQPPVVPETPNVPITPTTPIVPTTPENSNGASCELVEHYRGVCNGKGTYLTIKHLTDEAVIANFRIASLLKNDGFISDMLILPTAVVTGGKLSGEIHNQGIIRNVEFKGKSLEGGTLGGAILNSSPVYGRINHVHFEPCAFAQGGYWGGYLTGHPQHPVYLNNLTLSADTVLENAIIGEGVRVTGNTKQWRNVKRLAEYQNGAIRWDGQQNHHSTACFAPLQDSEFAFVSRPEIAHINKQADILTLAITTDNTHYSYQDSWQAIEIKVEALKVFKTLSLPSMYYVPKQLLTQKPNTILLFLGYRLSTGEIIYQQIE